MECITFQEHKNERLFYFDVKKSFIAGRCASTVSSLNCQGCNNCQERFSSFFSDTELNPCEGCEGCGSRCSVSPY